MLGGVRSEGVRRALFQFRCLGHSVSQTSTELPPRLEWKGTGTSFLSWERAALDKTLLFFGKAFSSVEKVWFKAPTELTSWAWDQSSCAGSYMQTDLTLGIKYSVVVGLKFFIILNLFCKQNQMGQWSTCWETGSCGSNVWFPSLSPPRSNLHQSPSLCCLLCTRQWLKQKVVKAGHALRSTGQGRGKSPCPGNSIQVGRLQFLG